MDNQQVYSYTYVCIGECGRFYIGSHVTNDLDDGYMGSCRDKSFRPIKKIILKFFQDYNGAVSYENFIQKLHGVVSNKQFANKSITPCKHPTYGIGHLESTKNQISKNKKESGLSSGEKNPAYGKVVKYDTILQKYVLTPISDNYPEHLVAPKRSAESRKKTSKSLKGRVFLDTHLENLSKSKTGTILYNNGIKNIFIKEGEIPPDGYKKGRCMELVKPTTSPLKTRSKPFLINNKAFPSQAEYFKYIGKTIGKLRWNKLVDSGEIIYISKEQYLNDYLEKE